MKPNFKETLIIGKDPGEDYDLVLGVPADVGNLDAEEGQKVGIYELVRVCTYRKNPSLE